MKIFLLSLTLLAATLITKAQIGPCSGTPMPVIAAQYMPACAGFNDTLYANAFLNKGLVAYYPFNGNANDLSGNGYNATTVGVSLATDRFGKPNKCYNFAGTSTYIQCPAATYFTGGNYTISGWVNVSSLGNWARMIDFGNGAGANNVLLALSEGSSNQLDMNNANNVNFTTNQVIDFNAWVQVLFTYNATTGIVNCYYNGIAVGQSTLPAPDNVVRNNCYIGLSNWGSDGGVFGSMDDIRIYNRELNSTEVSQLYNYEATGESQTTYAWSGGSTAPYIVSNSGTPSVVTYTLTQTRNGAGCSASDTFRLATVNCTAALDFDGVDDYVIIPNTAPLNNQFSGNQITVEGWFYTKAFAATGTVPTLIGEAYLGDGNVEFSMYLDDSGTLHAGFFDGAWEETTTTLTLNTWQHIACTYDMQNIKLYINGVLASSIAMTNPLPVGTEEWRIGRRWDFLETYNGQMDEISIWNTARTQAQIQNDINCSPTVTPTGLVAYYNFNQGVANQNNAGLTTLTDVTGNGNDGTLNNFALTGTSSNWVNDANMAGPVPSITSVVASNTLVCSGTTTTLTVNGTANSFTWGANAANATTTNVNINPTATATYVVVAANNNCKVMDSVTVNVNPLPTVVITPTQTIVCAGTKDTVTVSGATSYTWTPGNFHGTTLSSVVNTPISFTVTGTDVNGCKNKAVQSIAVNALPTVSVSVTNSVICMGASTKLTGEGANTYTWTGGVTDNTAFSPTITATYTVTGTGLNGCKNKATQTVGVNQLPTVSVSVTNSVICMGGSTTLMGSGASTYTWTGGVTDNTAFSPTVTATYSVNGTDVNGCVSSNTAVQSVTVNPLPNVTASATNTVICAGGTSTLMGGGANTYTWTGGVMDNTPFNPAGSGVDTYTVSGTENVNGCTNMAVISVTVNALPTVTVNSASICIGATATLTAGGATSYTWSTTDNTPSVMESPTTPTDYTVNGTDANGCVNMAVASVAVNSLPTVTVNSATICAGATATLTAGGATSYTWSTTATTTSISATPTITANYTVNGTDVNGCMGMSAATATVTVNTLPTVTVNSATICAGATATLTAGGATSYTWSTTDNTTSVMESPVTPTDYTVNGADANGCVNMAVAAVAVNALPTISVSSTTVSLCSGSTATLTASGAVTYTWSTSAVGATTVVSPTITATYTVMATDNNGCENMTTITQTVSTCSGIEQYNNSISVSVYPNPNTGTFVVSTVEHAKAIVVMDVLGNELLTVIPTDTSTTINLNLQANGIYFVKVIANNAQTIKRIVVNN